MRLGDVQSHRHAVCVPERMPVLEAAFPGGHRAITGESRLPESTWLALLDALCEAPVDAAQLAAALGEATKEFPFEGGESDAPSGAEYARLVPRSKLAAEIFRALPAHNAERNPRRLQAEVDSVLDAGDASGFQAAVGEMPLSRYPMWATFSDSPGARMLSNPQTAEDDWLRLGLSPDVPRRMVAMWYQLPAGQVAHIPTICNANAGASVALNPCFQPAPIGIHRGQTVRCSNLDAVDGYPEVVHIPVTASAVTGIAARSR